MLQTMLALACLVLLGCDDYRTREAAQTVLTLTCNDPTAFGNTPEVASRLHQVRSRQWAILQKAVYDRYGYEDLPAPKVLFFTTAVRDSEHLTHRYALPWAGWYVDTTPLLSRLSVAAYEAAWEAENEITCKGSYEDAPFYIARRLDLTQFTICNMVRIGASWESVDRVMVRWKEWTRTRIQSGWEYPLSEWWR